MPFRCSIGQLRCNVKVEKLVTSYNACNEPVDTWTTLAGCIACRITAKGGGERTISDKQISVVSFEVVMRYRHTVLPDMRIDWDGKKLNIDAVFDPDGSRMWLLCLCKEAAL